MPYLIALICLCLPAYLIRFSIFNIPTTALEILIYVVFIIGLFNIRRAAKIPRPYLWPIGLLILAVAISIYVSPNKHTALGELKAFFIDPILVWWLAVSYLKRDDTKWLIAGLAGSSLIVSSHAIYQKIIGQVTADGRVVGLFGYSPNYLALFLAPITAMLIAYGVWLMAKSKHMAYGVWLIALIDIIAIYLSGSRGGLLALGGGIVFYLILRYWSVIRSKLWLKVGIGIIIAVSIIVAAWAFRPDFSLSGDSGNRAVSSNNVRWQIWETTLELGGKHPIFGVGLGNFQNAFNELTKNRVNFPEFITPWALTPHNLFLMFWLTTGGLGLIASIWLIAYSVWQGLKNLSPQKIIILTGLVVIILQGLVDTPYFKNDLSVLFWLIIAGIIVEQKK